MKLRRRKLIQEITVALLAVYCVFFLQLWDSFQNGSQWYGAARFGMILLLGLLLYPVFDGIRAVLVKSVGIVDKSNSQLHDTLNQLCDVLYEYYKKNSVLGKNSLASIDIMVPCKTKEIEGRYDLIRFGPESASGKYLLKIARSAKIGFKTALVPVHVSNFPWFGVGEAYLHGSIVYVPDFFSQIDLEQYNLPDDVKAKIIDTYNEVKSRFKALLSIPVKNEKEDVIALLNFNYNKVEPVGSKQDFEVQKAHLPESLYKVLEIVQKIIEGSSSITW